MNCGASTGEANHWDTCSVGEGTVLLVELDSKAHWAIQLESVKWWQSEQAEVYAVAVELQ